MQRAIRAMSVGPSRSAAPAGALTVTGPRGAWVMVSVMVVGMVGNDGNGAFGWWGMPSVRLSRLSKLGLALAFFGDPPGVFPRRTHLLDACVYAWFSAWVSASVRWLVAAKASSPSRRCACGLGQRASARCMVVTFACTSQRRCV